MAQNGFAIMDSDGHLVESPAELPTYCDDKIKFVASGGVVAQRGPWPTLDGIHNYFRGTGGRMGGPRQTASEERTGSGEDWSEFLNKTGIEKTVIFPTEGLAVGFIQSNEYATYLCRAYNDYVAERYAGVDDRIHPVALIPMQDPPAAAAELRRAVKELGLLGAMLPSTGLPLHLGHDFYDTVYREAADLDCVLAIHGGSNKTIGIDTFSDFIGSHVLHHPVPLMYAFIGYMYHGVFDRYPNLRFAFLEGGPSWLVPLIDRTSRDDEFFGTVANNSIAGYLQSGRILIGCEGNDDSLPYVANKVGIESFAYSSDYPHEVDMAGAMHEIEETVESEELTREQKQAVLADNTKRFYRL
jgi:predicted TIM-barrel fold metal-dependent hydrolase